MSRKKPDEYEIHTFEQLLNVVNAENSQRLAIDLGSWLMWYAKVMDNTRKEYPEETEGKLNCEIAKSGFTWIDDGKHELKSVSVTDPRTGKKQVRKPNQ
jgi:hypothetical protein